MGIMDSIRTDAVNTGADIKCAHSADELQHILDKMFFAPLPPNGHNVVAQMVYAQHREMVNDGGQYASDFVGPDFCLRRQVLSLVYRPNSPDISASYARIRTAEYTAVEKWRRLFVAAGYIPPGTGAMGECREYKIKYPSDILCYIPEFYGWDAQERGIRNPHMVCTVMTCSNDMFNVSGDKYQWDYELVQFYMQLTGTSLGFCIVENRNNLHYRVHIYKRDESAVKPMLERAANVVRAYGRLIDHGKMPAIPEKYKSGTGQICRECRMFDACRNRGKGRILLTCMKK